MRTTGNGAGPATRKKPSTHSAKPGSAIRGAAKRSTAKHSFTATKMGSRELEQALRRSDKRLRSTLDSMLEGCLIISPDARCLYVNDAAAAQAHRTKEQLLGHTVTEVFAGIENAPLFSAVSRCLHEQRPTRIENEFIFRDGSKGWFQLSIQPVPEGILILSTDTTERKRVEESLRESESRIRAMHTTLLAVTAERDLTKLLGDIVRRAAQLLDGTGGGLYLCDSEKQVCTCVVSHKTPRDFVGTQLKYGEGAAGTVAASGQPLVIEDYRTWEGRAKAFETEQPFRAIIAAPLLWHGQASGVIDVLRDQPFIQAHLELLSMFASQAAIALENARALDAERAARIRAEKEITERKQAQAALRETEQTYRSLFESISSGVAIYEAVNNGDDFVFKDLNRAGEKIERIKREDIIGKCVTEAFPGVREFGVFEVFQRVWRTGKSEYFADHIYRDARDTGTWRDSWVYRSPTAEIVAVYNDITERKNVERALHDARERLQALNQRVLDAQEDERRSIARELHDQVGQTLSALKINLQLLQRQVDPKAGPLVQTSLQAVDSVLQNVRELSLNLRPSALDDLGLVPALRWYLTRQAEPAKIGIEIAADEFEPRLRPRIETECFRIIQEAVTNIIRHAQARHIRLEIRKDETALSICIRDDGIGFDLANMQKRARAGYSMGLLSMQDRASLMGAKLEIASAPGSGTEIRMHLPLTSVRDQADDRMVRE